MNGIFVEGGMVFDGGADLWRWFYGMLAMVVGNGYGVEGGVKRYVSLVIFLGSYRCLGIGACRILNSSLNGLRF